MFCPRGAACVSNFHLLSGSGSCLPSPSGCVRLTSVVRCSSQSHGDGLRFMPPNRTQSSPFASLNSGHGLHGLPAGHRHRAITQQKKELLREVAVWWLLWWVAWSVLRSEKGCRIRVTHVHTRSDSVHTRDDTVRLNYASRFVRVIYSSHIVSISLVP